jgi:hypothetical protein
MMESIAPKERTNLSAFDLLDIACIALTALAGVALATNTHNAARSVAAFVFVIYIPGRAIVSNWPEIAVKSVTAVSILFSLSLNTLIATIALWIHFWHPAAMLEVECVLVILALVVAILRRRGAFEHQRQAVDAIGEG